jgi:hypothetical protein
MATYRNPPFQMPPQGQFMPPSQIPQQGQFMPPSQIPKQGQFMPPSQIPQQGQFIPPGQMVQYPYQVPKTNYMEKADSMLLSCGTFATYFSAAICCIILICVVAVAFYMYTKKEEELIKTNAVITDRSCNSYFTTESNGKRVQRTSCLITVKYTVDDKEYINSFETSDVNIYVNQTIVIEYAKNDPNIIYYKHVRGKTIGMILFGVSGCILLFLIIHLILLNVSDWYKRLQCISMVASAFR